MFILLRFPLFGIVAAACLMAAPSWSASVTALPGAPTGGTIIDLVVDDFERLGNCGGGGSVVGDGCSAIVKTDPAAPDAFGRFDPLGNYWIDSQDINELKWTVRSPDAFTSMAFALTDAHDQLNSFFVMSFLDGATWTPVWDIATRKDNANLYWLSVDLGEAVNEAVFRFSTKVVPGFDGYGISSLTVSTPAPIPVPPAALLLGTGALAMAGLRRKKSRR